MFTAQIHIAGDVAAGQIYGGFTLPCAAVLTELQASAQKAPANGALSLVPCGADGLAVAEAIIIAPGEQHTRVKLPRPVLFAEGGLVRVLAFSTGAQGAPGGFVTITLVFKTKL